ncbi:hypothetical protein QRO08_16755 [Paracidovorax citrulli]|nr:hypothetical protein [Paracidovorax citrulli]ATG94794.1 hypothetical protein CQB05_12755 [Paracidovorax citrulli]MVT38483.1 hypothetical protein [Paracidovorax citrulli]PVY66383.1 hypothetical protein C8E08_3790 [Paracidovorax citrulli]REG69446.1 hypothetical protein C8E07_2597 [Paracidovorax citrulli]RLJ94000.1 hypothetical protein C8E06_2596 [Paracidovorax citrulli]
MEVQSEFRQVFLPYCLIKTADGAYVVVNRRYKPVGIVLTDWVNYDKYPVKVRFKKALSKAQIAALDYAGRTDDTRIYLYNDACVPTSSAANWRAYSDRLGRLAKYAVLHEGRADESSAESHPSPPVF